MNWVDIKDIALTAAVMINDFTGIKNRPMKLLAMIF
jgi:hypothetical protein